MGRHAIPTEEKSKGYSFSMQQKNFMLAQRQAELYAIPFSRYISQLINEEYMYITKGGTDKNVNNI